MVQIATGRRQNRQPGGGALPSPDFTRVQIAGTTGRGIEQLGNVAQDIALKQQRANDNAEFETATIDAQSKVNDILAELKQTIQDPSQFSQRATEETDKILAGIKVGFRNRHRFKGITGRIKLGADKAILLESIGKTSDLSLATLDLIKDSNVEGVLLGTLSEDVAIRNVDEHIDDRTRNDILSLQEGVRDKKKFRARLAEAKFEKEFFTDPVNATKNLEANVHVGIEAKTNLIDKATRKATHLRAIRKQEMKLDREAREKDFFVRARKGEVTEDDLLQDAIDNPGNPMSEDAFRRTLNKINEVDRTGGLGSPDAFRETLRNMRFSPESFSLNEIYSIAEAESMNNEEIDNLEAEFGSLVGAKDPSDIVTYRDFKEGVRDRVKRLFAPSQFDVGADFDIKNLRYDVAYTFATGKARELFNTNKNIDAVVEETFSATLEHMAKYEKLLGELRDLGVLNTQSSALEIEKKTREILGRKENEGVTTTTVLPPESEFTEAMANQFERLLEQLDNGEITEEEFISKTDKLQGQEKQ